MKIKHYKIYGNANKLVSRAITDTSLATSFQKERATANRISRKIKFMQSQKETTASKSAMENGEWGVECCSN